MNQKLKELNQQITQFKELEIAKNCIKPVLGIGPHNSNFMFIGEAPGAEEDKTGEPFVGRSDKLLDELLASLNLKRNDVYITNIVKYRPPENRDPTKIEKEICGKFLAEEIQIIKPEVIITLGRHALNYFFPDEKIALTHGKILIKSLPNNLEQKILSLYHPAVALYNPNNKETLFRDIQILKKYTKYDS